MLTESSQPLCTLGIGLGVLVSMTLAAQHPEIVQAEVGAAVNDAAEVVNLKSSRLPALWILAAVSGTQKGCSPRNAPQWIPIDPLIVERHVTLRSEVARHGKVLELVTMRRHPTRAPPPRRHAPCC